MLPARTLLDNSSLIRPCACCSVLVDPSIESRPPNAYLSEIRAASGCCPICKLLVEAAGLVSRNEDFDVKLIRDGAAIRLGQLGPRISRLCFDIENAPGNRDDIPISFSILPEPGSTAHFALLRGWLEWCDTSHDCNTHTAEPQGLSPTRLIYVGNSDSEDICLYLPKEHDRVKYVALSHCWGKHPPSKTDPQFCTTDNNVDARMSGFKISELPETFQDAVRVTRELGIEYLWIDSLCIIQWNPDDWKREAGRMEDVFASSHCTIAATSAADPNAGFLARNRSTKYVRVQDATGNQICICTHIDNFEDDVEHAELNKRAWVLQERVLSRKTIHFSANQTYWECGNGVYCENLTKMRSSLRKIHFLLDPNFPDRLLKSGEGQTVEFLHFLIENYSKRDLTEPTDRCVAASGLEARISGGLQCSSKYGIFQKHLHRNLLWQASDTKMKRIAYGNKLKVPSWSWMAYSGGIKFIDIKIGSVSWVDDLAFYNERYSAALIADVGKFQDCSVRPYGDRYTISNSLGEGKGWIRYDIESDEKGGKEHCVVIGKAEVNADKEYYYILVVVSTQIDGEYRRIGVGMVQNCYVERLRTGVRIV